jgi:aspartate carbamoyltransferase catalytic subunit
MVVMRHANPGAAYFLSKKCKSSIINAGDGALETSTRLCWSNYSIREKQNVGEKKGCYSR